MWHAQDQKASSKTQEGLECYLLVHRSFCNNGRGGKGEKEIEEDQSSDGRNEQRKLKRPCKGRMAELSSAGAASGGRHRERASPTRLHSSPKKGGAPLTGSDLIKHKHSLFNF